MRDSHRVKITQTLEEALHHLLYRLKAESLVLVVDYFKVTNCVREVVCYDEEVLFVDGAFLEVGLLYLLEVPVLQLDDIATQLFLLDFVQD